MPKTSGFILRPTRKEFANFASYVKKIDKKLEQYGIVKIIPPKGWFEREYAWESWDLPIPAPIAQLASGRAGVYKVDILESKAMSLQDYHDIAQKREHPSKQDSHESIERKFWKSLGIASVGQPPLYGADIVGSLFGDDDASSWNVNKLDSILRLLGNDNLPGITCSMLYIGMWRAMFAFHVEDMNLYSINYLHVGAPKRWYCVSPDHADRFESLANSYFPDLFEECRQFLRHKVVMISPSKLRERGIPFTTLVQEAGEFVITSPRAYHCGFNHGFNIAEATNFATERWMDFGKRAKVCQCSPYSVKIDMDYFDTRYRRHLKQKGAEKSPVTAQKCSHTSDSDNVSDNVSESNQSTMGWLFRCMCGIKCTEDEPPSKHPVGEQFECSECGVWCHVKCIYGETATLEKLDEDAICHVCARINARELIDGKVNMAKVQHEVRVQDSDLIGHTSEDLTSPSEASTQMAPEPKSTERGPSLAIKSIPTTRPCKKGKIVKGSSVCALPITGQKVFGVVDAIEDGCARIHFKNTRREADMWIALTSDAICLAEEHEWLGIPEPSHNSKKNYTTDVRSAASKRQRRALQSDTKIGRSMRCGDTGLDRPTPKHKVHARVVDSEHTHSSQESIENSLTQVCAKRHSEHGADIATKEHVGQASKRPRDSPSVHNKPSASETIGPLLKRLLTVQEALKGKGDTKSGSCHSGPGSSATRAAVGSNCEASMIGGAVHGRVGGSTVHNVLAQTSSQNVNAFLGAATFRPWLAQTQTQIQNHEAALALLVKHHPSSQCLAQAVSGCSYLSAVSRPHPLIFAYPSMHPWNVQFNPLASHLNLSVPRFAQDSAFESRVAPLTLAPSASQHSQPPPQPTINFATDAKSSDAAGAGQGSHIDSEVFQAASP